MKLLNLGGVKKILKRFPVSIKPFLFLLSARLVYFCFYGHFPNISGDGSLMVEVKTQKLLVAFFPSQYVLFSQWYLIELKQLGNKKK